MKPSTSVVEFLNRFPDDNTCLEYVFRTRYGHLERCPRCQNTPARFYRIKRRKAYECGRCSYQIYPLVGTLMANSTTSLFVWFYAIFIYAQSKNGISSRELQNSLGVSYKTAYKIGSRIRGMMAQSTHKLSGHVELDEALFGPRCRGKRGWGAGKKASLFGMLQRNGDLRLIIVPNRKRKTLLPLIHTNVRKRAHISTDEFKVYQGLSRLNYTHGVVVHHKYQWANGVFSTNGVEGSWSNLKKFMLGTHTWVSLNKLEGYVNAYVYRYNHRKRNLFDEMLNSAVARA